MTPKEWLNLNWKIGAFSFGGGGRAIYYHEALVKKAQEISADEFQEATTISQMVPGPNLVNLGTYLGIRLAGLRWMLLGFLLLCLPGAFVGVLLLYLIDFENPHIALLFKGFSLGSVTFFLIFVYRLLQGLRTDVVGNIGTSKLLGRALLACLVAYFSLSGFSLSWILIVAIPIALAFEFQRWI